MPQSLKYNATKEQLQSWAYHKNADLNQKHLILTHEAKLSAVDRDCVVQAIEILYQRHESLRTCFLEEEGVLKQYIFPYEKKMFAPDVLNLTEPVLENRLFKACIESGEHVVSDLGSLPLCKFILGFTSQNDCYFYLLIHHIISDVWSIGIINQELVETYALLVSGKTDKRPQPKMQISDYAQWQEEWLKNNLDNVIKYWKNKVANALNADSYLIQSLFNRNGTRKLQLKTEEFTLHQQNFIDVLNSGSAAVYSSHISPELFEQLKSMAVATRTTLNVIINTSLQILFQVVNHGHPALMAMSVISRPLPQMQQTIGCLVGGIYLCRHLDAGMTIRDCISASYLELLTSIKHIIYDHEDSGLGSPLMRALSDVYLNYFHIKSVKFGYNSSDSTTNTHQPLLGPEYYALSYFALEYMDGLSFQWKYNTELYAEEVIDQLNRRHHSILKAMTSSFNQSQITLKDLNQTIIGVE